MAPDCIAPSRTCVSPFFPSSQRQKSVLRCSCVWGWTPLGRSQCCVLSPNKSATISIVGRMDVLIGARGDWITSGIGMLLFVLRMAVRAWTLFLLLFWTTCFLSLRRSNICTFRDECIPSLVRSQVCQVRQIQGNAFGVKCTANMRHNFESNCPLACTSIFFTIACCLSEPEIGQFDSEVPAVPVRLFVRSCTKLGVTQGVCTDGS